MLVPLPKNIISKNSGFLPIENTQKLEVSELRYRRLFETAQDGILILDALSGKITDANPFLKDLLGYTDSELLGKQLWEIGVFKDIVDSKKAFLELQNEGYIRYKDLPLETKDGRSIDVEFVSNVYTVDSQTVIQCNIRDITNRKKAEEAVVSRTKELETLSKSQEETKKAMLNIMEDLEEAKTIIEIEKAKDEAMLSSIGEGLIAVENDRKIMIINKMAENMLGWKMKDVIGKKLPIFPLEDEEGNLLPLIKRPVHIALTTGKTRSGTFFHVKKDRTRFPIAITVTPIKLSEKKIGAIIIFRDVTREREIDRAKSEFVSLASHQLRTPLGIAKWYLEALRAEGYLDQVSEKAQDYLSEVYKSNERLITLVRDLLSVSRIDQGTVRDVPKIVNVPDLVQSVIKELRIIAGRNKILIELVLLKPKIPELFIDPFRTQQILENLIVNAIEYSHTGGTVTITLDSKDNKVQIAVKDTGIGISVSDQKKLFTKFFRAVKATTKNTEGTGLGLYVVKSYVKGWGGEIFVQSVEGKGSTFTITLPTKRKINSQKKGGIVKKDDTIYDLGER